MYDIVCCPCTDLNVTLVTLAIASIVVGTYKELFQPIVDKYVKKIGRRSLPSQDVK